MRRCDALSSASQHFLAQIVDGRYDNSMITFCWISRGPSKELTHAAKLVPIVAVILSCTATTAFAIPEKARPAQEFVDSIGINTHWNYGDTPYGYAYAAVKHLLVTSGIRHIRGDMSRAVELSKAGVKTMVVADIPNNTNGDISVITRFKEQVKAINTQYPSIESVEGPNEVDLFWDQFKKSYNGVGYQQGPKSILAGAVAFQKDLYTVFKGDPATAKIPIVAFTLGKTYGYDAIPFTKGALAGYVDYGNMHPYPGGNPFSSRDSYDTIDWYIGHGTHPNANMDDDDHFMYAFDVYAQAFAPKPMQVSETGYSTNTDGETETNQAKYLPRLFAEYFRHGIARTYTYEFMDEFDDPGKNNREAHFGIVRRDLSPKPAYYSLQSVISALSDNHYKPQQKMGTLNVQIQVSPVGSYTKTQYVHHLLLQKSTRDFYLLLWHEIADSDSSVEPHRVINPPALPAIVSFSRNVAHARLFTLADSGKMSSVPLPIAHDSVSLPVGDKLCILKLAMYVPKQEASALPQHRKRVVKHRVHLLN